jgi:tRNA dimethylallyltransferase
LERRAIIIAGPTCSGKTYCAIKLAQKLNSEIISADSRQIYKYLTIGTAKPNPDEQKSIKHYFVDQLEPDEDYNVSRFENESIQIIKDLHAEDKIPVIAGGSGLYIKALVDGIVDVESADENYRERLLSIKKEKGIEYLYSMLQEVDPRSAAGMLPQNWKRVMRAIEVFELTGRSITEIHSEQKRDIDINFIQFGLNWERQLLYANIEKRVEQMIKDGLIDEVKSILDRGYEPDLNSLNTVGYKEIIAYLKDEYPIERAIELIKRNTRRYAKRQMTWFRKDTRIIWLDISKTEDLNRASDKILNEYLIS